MVYKVTEIFTSIEGEGKRSGLVVTFIRLAGCNLHCDWCDTSYARTCDEAHDMTAEEVVAEANRMSRTPFVTITGGEPLMQDAMGLARALLLKGFDEVNIETNGSIPLPERREYEPDTKPGSIFFTMDWKCPSSCCNGYMLTQNLNRLTKDDVIKFVVEDDRDLYETLRVLTLEGPVACIAQPFISPVFDAIDPKHIVEFMKKECILTRLQMQLHKLIWDPEARGV